jgi:hypothetical protein
LTSFDEIWGGGGEHKPFKLQFKQLIQRFLGYDSHPWANMAKRWSHGKTVMPVSQKWKKYRGTGLFAVSVINRYFRFRE